MNQTAFKSEKEDPVLRWSLGRSLTICGFSPAKKDGWAVALNAETIRDIDLDQAIRTIEQHVGVSVKSLDLKIVGPATKVSQCTALLDAKMLRLKGSASRESPEVEFLFYRNTGRLRITEDTVQTKGKIKVLIVDDSKTIRMLLENIIQSDPHLECVGVASHPSQVLKMIETQKPDVITLDIHMPDMDGVTLLKSLLPRHKIPVIMVTSVSLEQGSMVLEALSVGAIDYIQKPTAASLVEIGAELIEKVKAAAISKIVIHRKQVAKRPSRDITLRQDYLWAIGSSTGGTEALREVLTRWPEHIPPTVIVQHIPPVFSRAFAMRLNDICPFLVKEAEDGDAVVPDQVLIAPGGKHMRLVKSGAKLRVVIEETPPRNRHRPSVDVLFDSVVETMKDRAVGVILTGMGGDGAEGLLKMKNAGAHTIAQSEATCVVFGMPRRSIELDAANEIVDLPHIGAAMMKAVSSKR